jgi:membrane protein DedA with SNARE-associated domain
MITLLYFSQIFLDHGVFAAYFILFVLMFFEGPIVAFAASFLASLGYFNALVIFILFIFGNQIPDMILFKIGGSLRGERVEKFVSRFGLSKSRIVWLEKNLKRHFIKTTAVTKIVPPLPSPGIILSGFVKIPFKKFFWTYLIFNILYAAIFVLLGYYSGIAVSTFSHYFKLTEYVFLMALGLIVLIFILIRIIFWKVSSNLKY